MPFPPMPIPQWPFPPKDIPQWPFPPNLIDWVTSWGEDIAEYDMIRNYLTGW